MGHGDPDSVWSRGEELQHMTSFLQDLVRLRSVCGSTEGERAVAMRIVEEAQALGLSYEVVAKKEHRPNVIVSLGTDDGPTLFCFVAHIDTVDVGDENAWVHGSAFEARVDDDGRMYGRGTCDCKAGVAVSMYALRRLKVSGPKISIRLWRGTRLDLSLWCLGAGQTACASHWPYQPSMRGG